MRLPDEADVPAQINIVPMIDVIFAILTFFVMSTLFLTRQEGLPVNLPQASTAKQAAEPARVTLTVDKTGNLFLNKQPITLEALEAGVKEQVKPEQPLMVVLNADEGVNHGKIVEVMDKVRRVKGASLAIATRRD
ncbi:biopolymer transporter ExbD [Plectonema cf. radiosum LEGE 06105]|uniref:Biopolymer transporter ExbD n=1 Tax=Plectonema cf. radiosum LEGE 06105 TaxID=945769 RepID=A0A8J7F0M3_9CYAN|nr:biopolymer transporter ExbD [Plectonema radiosum]MBE9213613.1 biopolymer transporter ExbD [Plectonema cf. radiosum LEGE 06105]